MWGRLVEKWVQLFSDGVPWAGLAPIPARNTRQQSSAELGIVVLCLLLPVGLWFGFARARSRCVDLHLLVPFLYEGLPFIKSHRPTNFRFKKFGIQVF